MLWLVNRDMKYQDNCQVSGGIKPEEIARDYNIEVEDIYAALLYAAKVLGREEMIFVET